MPRETWQERKAREDAERDVVLAKVPEVARILGGAYTVDEYHTMRIAGADWRLRVYHNQHDNRLHISGDFACDLWRHHHASGPRADDPCSITVSPNRPAGRIAGDISARLLPVYRELHTTLTKRNDAHTRLQNAKQELAQRIAYAGRGKIVDPRHYSVMDVSPSIYTYFGANGPASSNPWGKAEISGYAADPDNPTSLGVRDPKKLTVSTMELHNIPAELAEYIASLLGEWAED